MKRVSVTLLADVSGLGSKGDVVPCSPGYARNALFAHGLGRPTREGDEQAVHERAAMQHKDYERRHREEERLHAALEGRTVSIPARVNADGNLYGSVGASAIATALVAAGTSRVTTAMVDIPAPITALGDHQVRVTVGSKRASVTVRVVAQK